MKSESIEVSFEEGERLIAEAEAEEAFASQVAGWRKGQRLLQGSRCPHCKQRLPVGFSRDLKCCTGCKVDLSLSLFYRNSQSQDGYRSECKSCYNDRQATYASQNPHRLWAQRILASRRQYGYTVFLTSRELEGLAKSSTSCSCERQLRWRQGKDGPIIHRVDCSPHLVTSSKVITLNSVRIMCGVCAKLAWKRTPLIKKKLRPGLEITDQEILSKAKLSEQKPVDGVHTVKMNFFGENEQTPSKDV